MIKVAYILDDFPDPSAGTEGQLWQLWNALDRNVVEPRIVLLRDSPFLRENLRSIPITVLGIRSVKNAGALTKAVRLCRALARDGVEVAHIFFNDSAVLFPPLLKLFGIRSIVSRRDLGLWSRDTGTFLSRLVSPFVDRYLANCEAVRAVVMRDECGNPARSEVILNACKPDAFKVTADAAVTAKFGLQGRAPLLLMVANLRPLKRIGDAVRALAPLHERFPDALLAVAGADRPTAGGGHRAELEATARELGVLDNVRFLGPVRNVAPLIAAADVCMLLSETEGLSNSLIEYMCAGKPVIATKVGGAPEILRDGENGLLVDVGDITAISRAIERLATDAAFAERLGTNARATARALFEPEKVLAQYLDLYRRLARPGMPRALEGRTSA
jgi:glycosyltransferase involved in cell wall biosynthesis